MAALEYSFVEHCCNKLHQTSTLMINWFEEIHCLENSAQIFWQYPVLTGGKRFLVGGWVDYSVQHINSKKLIIIIIEQLIQDILRQDPPLHPKKHLFFILSSNLNAIKMCLWKSHFKLVIFCEPTHLLLLMLILSKATLLFVLFVFLIFDVSGILLCLV